MINSRGRARLEDPPFPPTKCPLDPSPDARTESVITATAPGHGRVFVAALEADQMGRHDRILFRARLPRGGAGFDLMEARSGGFLGVERGRPAVDASIPTNGRPADWSRRTLPPNTSPNSDRRAPSAAIPDIHRLKGCRELLRRGSGLQLRPGSRELGLGRLKVLG